MSRYRLKSGVLTALLLAAAASVIGNGCGGPPATNCVRHSDCQTSDRCVKGYCELVETGDGSVDEPTGGGSTDGGSVNIPSNG